MESWKRVRQETDLIRTGFIGVSNEEEVTNKSTTGESLLKGFVNFGREVRVLRYKGKNRKSKEISSLGIRDPTSDHGQ